MSAEPTFTRCEQLLEKAIWQTEPLAVEPRSPQDKWRRRLMSSLTKVLGLARILPTGSWAHGTAIAGYSDWDYFLVAEQKDKPASPDAALSGIATALRFNVESLVEWQIDRPAVRVIDPFDDSKLDLVPAFPSSQHEYQIADLVENTWMDSNPTAHVAFIDRAGRHNQDLIPLIRLMKCWKYANAIPISSLYLEMKTSLFVLNDTSHTRLESFMGILKSILRDGLLPIQDPSVPQERLLEPMIDNTSSRSDLLKVISSSLEIGHRLDAAEKSRASEEVEIYFESLLPDALIRSSYGRRPYLRNFHRKSRKHHR